MRPKTFPATTYSGNSRQRLQEIREGLKQPSKSSGQGLPIGAGSETSLDPKILIGKDAARQQQMRQTPKFGPYQKALREIRYSLLPFANESSTTAAVEVNRQMLQELVNAGCDQVCVSWEEGLELLPKQVYTLGWRKDFDGGCQSHGNALILLAVVLLYEQQSRWTYWGQMCLMWGSFVLKTVTVTSRILLWFPQLMYETEQGSLSFFFFKSFFSPFCFLFLHFPCNA